MAVCGVFALGGWRGVGAGAGAAGARGARPGTKRFQAAVDALDKAIGLRESEELSQYREALASIAEASK